MKRKKILALADRVEIAPAYDGHCLGGSMRRVDKRKSRKDVYVILVQDKYRSLIAEALRRFAE